MTVFQGLARRLAGWPAYRWACLMLAGYFVAALAGTWVNYLDLHLIGGIGYYDLSINQQALSSSVHGGRPFPFYEATNCGRDGRCSFLLVHPVFLAYAVVGPYAAWSSPFTLFAIQDLALALAALPLFGIARIVTGSNRLSLAVVGAYLVWLPAFSGVFSFHWEAFLPIEFFTVFWLWLTHRYLLAIPVVIVAYITLEITPILLFFLAVYFLLDWLRPTLRFLRVEMAKLVRGGDPRSRTLRTAMGRIRVALLAQPRLRASVFLLLGSALAYYLLHVFVTGGGGSLLGLPPLPRQYAIPLTRPVYAAVFSFSNLATAWPSKLLFWIVIYATLAMVPLLAPRTLVFTVPWIAFSLLATSGYYRMGDQYGFISAAVLFIGFVYGVARLKRWAETRPSPKETAGGPSPRAERLLQRTQRLLEELRAPPPAQAQAAEPAPWAEGAPSAIAPGPPTTQGPFARPTSEEVQRWWRRRRRVARVSLTVVLVAVISVNLFLNPLNPYSAPLKGDRPFVPQSALGLNAGLDTTDYQHVEHLVAIIGSRSIVAVSPVLFTFVANDPYAYPLLGGMNDSHLPFNALTGTQYVLLVNRGGTSIPLELKQNMTNTSVFGVRAWIPTTTVGGVLLFQRGYTGPTEVLGTTPVFGGGTFTAGAGLTAGKAGTLAANATSQSGTVIETAPQPGNATLREGGRVFVGPGVTLPGGSWQVTVALNGSEVVPNPTIPVNTSVVTLLLSGFQDTVSRMVLNISALSGEDWTLVRFQVPGPYPILNFNVAGFNRYSWFRFQVDFVSITPIPGP